MNMYIMEKKFYSKPIVEQTECFMFAALCSSDMVTSQPGGGERPGGGTSAPRRRVF